MDFINGTAYAGKSTMCKMLAGEYGMVHCEERYNLIGCDGGTAAQFELYLIE